MKPFEDKPQRPADDEESMDLLVDGELDEARRRELLARLDERPGAWRRLALAFLEAQCWRREMHEIARPVQAPSPHAPSPSRRGRLEGRAVTVLAMAVSFLIALGLGTFLRDVATRSGGGGRDPAPLAERGGQGKEPRVSPGGASDPRRPGGVELAGSQSPWQWVPLGVGAGPDGARETVQLPAREGQTLDEQWLRSLPPAMPESVEQALRRAGHEVHQSRQLVPVQLEDGRQLVVPMDEIDVRPVGRRGYQ